MDKRGNFWGGRVSRRCMLAGLCVWGAALPGLAMAALPETVQQLKPSVLMVGTYAETDTPRFNFRGTGFAVLEGRHVLTNAHVIPEAAALIEGRRLVVQVPEGKGRWSQRTALVVAQDASRDLALLSIDGAPLKALRLAATEQLREGMDIALMGFPLAGAVGYTAVTHRGVLAAMTDVVLPPPVAQALSPRAIRQLRDGSFPVMQLDVTAYPGNSGGPVFEPDSGLVLGVVSMVLIKGTRESALSAPTGITYAIPADVAAEFMRSSRP